ncbi:hypothetical protein V1520DRAFT_376046 [Lipomyces starkeyi]|uniref:Uncharacterized protein n=1 Tax=Lipomyces starkeyi NRRL Y-11557 TaxID=675824 RepID=A0A1E3QGM9_LIPST|nr:hypothetical protein LIPSTDRAFT_745 [Lipomyces starkeyi NRRL Y-11557]
MAALGFLTTCARLTFGDVVPPNLGYMLLIVRLALLAAFVVVLGIVGAVEISNNSVFTTGHSLQKAPVLLITAVFAVVIVSSLYLLGFAKAVRSQSHTPCYFGPHNFSTFFELYGLYGHLLLSALDCSPPCPQLLKNRS